MDHVNYYERLEDVYKAVKELSGHMYNMWFHFYFDIECNNWVLIYGEKED